MANNTKIVVKYAINNPAYPCAYGAMMGILLIHMSGGRDIKVFATLAVKFCGNTPIEKVDDMNSTVMPQSYSD